MADANTLLFEKVIDGRPLFKNQSDLINKLLQTPAYKVDYDDVFAQTKALNRLKAYISQLLSGSANRTITPEFKQSMDMVLSDRLPNMAAREKILDEIFEAMKEKSSLGLRDNRQSASASFQIAVLNSPYVSVFTSTPVKIEFIKDGEKYSLTDFFLSDLLDCIANQKLSLKRYRFNFPLKNDCQVFWLGLDSAFVHKLYEIIDDEDALIRNVNSNASSRPDLQEIYDKYGEFTKAILEQPLYILKIKLVQQFAINLIELLNKNDIVLTFAVDEPIYSIPLIALEPNDALKTKLFSLIEDEKLQTHLIQCSREYMLLWRRFVWNKVLTSKNVQNVPCPQLDVYNK